MEFPEESKPLNLPAVRQKAEVIFENENFLAVNKPPGLLTIPDRHDDTLPSLYKTLQQQYPKIFIVHRLDKDTSGIILFAKDEGSHKELSQLFEQRDIEKYYLGIILGSMNNKAGIIEEPLAEHPGRKGKMIVHAKGKPSVTEYTVVEDFRLFSLVQFKILTGRTHQIRVQVKHLGHPIACDELYGDGKPILVSSFKKKYKLSAKEDAERPILSRLALHSSQVKFHFRGSQFDLKAEMPKDINALVNQLRKVK